MNLKLWQMSWQCAGCAAWKDAYPITATTR